MVSYPKKTSTPVHVHYSIIQQGNFKTITCAVPSIAEIPTWLELRKFELVAMKYNGNFELLFEHRKYEKNMDTVLFMDKVFDRKSWKMKSIFISRVLAVKLIWVSTGLQLECETHDVQAKYR